ncbi:MAG: hypothetical protein AAF649_07905 [Verrucomicrobiota bacterium]
MESFEEEITKFKPRTVPTEWKRDIMAASSDLSEEREQMSWLQVFQLPQLIRWGVAGAWLLILCIKGMTPVTEPLEPFAQVITLEVLAEHSSTVQMAVNGNFGNIYLTEKGARFEVRIYEN